MPTTPRFGLTSFGGPLGGSLSENPRATYADPQTLDRILAALEEHDHSGGARLVDPTAAPVLEQLDTGGFLPADTTFFYRVAFVDRYGLETAASPEVSITTPAQTATPPAPSVAVESGGTLPEGTYFYSLTAITGEYETRLSAPMIVQILAPNQTVRVGLPGPAPNVDSYGVWRMHSEEMGPTRLGIVDPEDLFILDDGTIPNDPCPTDPRNAPPEENRTNSTNVIIITTPDPELVGIEFGPVRRWRIYRSTVSGVYDTASRIVDVTETVEEDSGGLVTTFMDTGLDPGPGEPLGTSQTLRPSVQIVGGGAGGVVTLVNGIDDEVWRVVCQLDGALETRRSQHDPVGTPVLQSQDGTSWRLRADAQGVLITASETAMPGDLFHAFGSGPFLPSSDPLRTFKLSVNDDGALVTTDLDHNGGA